MATIPLRAWLPALTTGVEVSVRKRSPHSDVAAVSTWLVNYHMQSTTYVVRPRGVPALIRLRQSPRSPRLFDPLVSERRGTFSLRFASLQAQRIRVFAARTRIGQCLGCLDQ